MESKEKKTTKKKAPKKPSGSAPEQKSKKTEKKNDNEHSSQQLIEENKSLQNQIQIFEVLFERQSQLLEKQNEISKELSWILEKILLKDNDSPKVQTGEDKRDMKSQGENNNYVLFRNAYHNLAQRNISREEKVNIEVNVSESYRKKLEELENQDNQQQKYLLKWML